MLRHKLWHASCHNLKAVSLHAYPSLPATPLACDHDHGDRSRIGCAAFVMLRNMPPHRIVMATGPEGYLAATNSLVFLVRQARASQRRGLPRAA
jgi:hypothetical protein